MAQGVRGTRDGIVDLCDVFRRSGREKTIDILRKTDSIRRISEQRDLDAKELGLKISQSSSNEE